MGLLADLAELVSPTRCAGCDMPGALLCTACRELATRFALSESCPRCAAPFGRLVCTECWRTGYAFSAAHALGEMGPPLSRAVVLYKDGHERRLGACLGEMLGEAVDRRGWREWSNAVSWVPSSAKACRRRGFDHAEDLAAAIAQAIGRPALPLLTRTSGHDQRQLGRAQRAANVRQAFTTSESPPAHVVLVDDVMTTGSTLDEAASALLLSGASEVRVAVVARAW